MAKAASLPRTRTTNWKKVLMVAGASLGFFLLVRAVMFPSSSIPSKKLLKIIQPFSANATADHFVMDPMDPVSDDPAPASPFLDEEVEWQMAEEEKQDTTTTDTREEDLPVPEDKLDVEPAIPRQLSEEAAQLQILAPSELVSISKGNNWGILFLADEESQKRYRVQMTTLQCYAKRHGYALIADHNQQQTSTLCSKITNFFFRKHCRVAEIMAMLPHIQWFMVVDGDTFIVNATTRLDYYLQHDGITDDTFVLHYERYHNGEIAAGNYMARNVPAAHAYLKEWADYEFYPLGSPNYDNGALHIHLLANIFSKESDQYKKCEHMFHHAAYDSYIACIKCQIGKRRSFPNAGIFIFRRGHAFVRDFFVSCLADISTDGNEEANIGSVIIGDPLILFHGWKRSLLAYYTSEPTDACNGDNVWDPPLREDRKISMEVGKANMQQREQFAHTYRSGVVIRDVGECWPHCPDDLTDAQEKETRAIACAL
jgi:hypothetical protein